MPKSQGDSPERRHAQRTTLEIPVDYGTVDAFFTDFSANINGGGVFIETESPADPETEVQLSFRLPGREEPVKVEGRVAWVSDGSTGQPQGMGIEFHSLSPETHDHINAVARSLRKIDS